MPRTSTTIPRDLDLLIDGAVEAGEFTSKSSAIETIVSTLFEENERLRFAAVCGINSLAQHTESGIEVSNAELLQMADIADEDLQRALAIQLGADADTDTLLGEIKRSVPEDPDENS